MTRIFLSMNLAKIRLLAIVLLILIGSFNSLAEPSREPPFILPGRAEVSKLRSGIIELSTGVVRFELFPEIAPWHVANLKWLADQGFFMDRMIDTVKQGYILQFGRLNRDEFARFVYSIPPEFNDRKHDRGTIGMARLPDEKNPSRESSSTQLHILLKDVHKMDGNYTPFGRVIDGMDLLERAQVGDRIRNLIVYVRR